MIRLDNITFSYNDKPVFNDYTLILPDSGITAVTGESGCGKTTLLRLIAGLEKPQKGTLEVPISKEIAIMFQENRLLPALDCTEQITAVLPENTDVRKYLEAVELGTEAHTFPEKMSGGMQRRVALARCLAYAGILDKKLLLLDEPFTGIDPPRVQRIISFIRSMRIPVIFTAHDREAQALADEIIPMWKPE